MAGPAPSGGGLISEGRAVWRPNPITEWDLAADSRYERRRRRSVWLLAAASLGACPVACFGFSAAIAPGFVPWAFVLLLVVFVATLCFREAEEARARRAALRQEFAGVDGWFVELSIHQGDVVSGLDWGVAWFEDGRLYFAGARTSFGLRLGALAAPLAAGGKFLEPRQWFVAPLRVASDLGPVVLGLRVDSPKSSPGAIEHEIRFQRAYAAWQSSGDQTIGQLPPLSPGPDLPSTTFLRNRALAATLVWPTLAVLLLASLAIGFGMVDLVVLAGVAASLWPPLRSPRRCWQAVRGREVLDRGALDREAR